jgi:hypothetical protein
MRAALRRAPDVNPELLQIIATDAPISRRLESSASMNAIPVGLFQILAFYDDQWSGVGVARANNHVKVATTVRPICLNSHLNLSGLDYALRD